MIVSIVSSILLTPGYLNSLTGGKVVHKFRLFLGLILVDPGPNEEPMII
jgi:hypothetical protein